MNSWDLLGYYETSNEEYEHLKQWNKEPRNMLYNLEFPLTQASQLIKLLEGLGLTGYDPELFIHYVSAWQKPILDGIRLGLYESLKAHHKNRNKVEIIINGALSDDWIETTLREESDILSLKAKIRTTISQVARATP